MTHISSLRLSGQRWLIFALFVSWMEPTLADDTEVFFFTPPGSNGRPNVLFIIDTGATMNNPVEAAIEFDPDVDYITKVNDSTIDCKTDRYYYVTGDAPPPSSCVGLPYINTADWKCQFYTEALLQAGAANTISVGFYDKPNKRWLDLENNKLSYPSSLGYPVECAKDRGVHGDGVNQTYLYANNGTGTGWGTNDKKEPWINISEQYTIYTGQGIAYQRFLTDNKVARTRLEAVKLALLKVVETSPGVNIGLMRFDNNGASTSGGMVMHEFASSETKGVVDSFDDILFKRTACTTTGTPECVQVMQPSGRKPIGETLYEAYQYFEGGKITYGLNSNIRTQIQFPSVPGSWYDPPGTTPTSEDLDPPSGTDYNSPVEAMICGGRNYIVLLTDGFTEQDRSADTGKIQSLWSSPSVPDPPLSDGGTCDKKVYVDGDPEKGQAIRFNEQKNEDEFATEDLRGLEGSPPGEAEGSYCVDDLAEFMYQYGVKGGRNKISTYTIGFQLDDKSYGDNARQLLQETARRGGGKYYEASDPDGLTVKLNSLMRTVLIDNASFTSPSVTVNAFNRTQNLNDLYISVFRPSLGYRWQGNLKKYLLKPGPAQNDDIRDRFLDAAVGSDGFFKSDSNSFWPDSALGQDGEDGADARLGGAAGQLDAPGERTIYTNLAESGPLSVELSELSSATYEEWAKEQMFGSSTYVPSGCGLTVDQLVKWTYGYPVTTDDTQSPCAITVNTGGARKDMGDPLHSRPVAITYGGTAERPDVVLFVTTNDGFLHAFKAGNDKPGTVDPVGGEELWAFIPRQLLGRLNALYLNEDTSSREYGLDSPIRVLRFDADQDGNIESGDGDRVILYFGMRRGGSHYFAVDVTAPNSPRLLWRIGEADANIADDSSKHLPGIGETWSVPAIARVNIDRGAGGWGSTEPQKSRKYVLVFGGGYNTNHDQQPLNASGDGDGNRIFMVDAFTGELLWRAAPPTDSAGGAKLSLSKMTFAIASDVRVIDLTGDGLADRMYASDLGGRVWRFDIYNGKKANEGLVTGGVFASLGNADNATPGTPDYDTRRFFTAPDAALITYANQTWINIAIGSGHREKPVTDLVTRNRFYGLRDYRPFTKLTQPQYEDWESSNMIRDLGSDASCSAVDATSPTLTGLVNVTNCVFPVIPQGSPGWKLDMKAGGNWSDGEKVLADSVTFEGIVYFPSFSPTDPQPNSEKCPLGQPDEDGDGVCDENDFCPTSDPGDVVSKTGCILECSPGGGLNRLYQISAANAAPKLLWDNPTLPGVSVGDRYQTLAQGGIAPPAVFIFPRPEEEGGPNPAPICLVGLAECGGGAAGKPVRTFWRQRGAD